MMKCVSAIIYNEKNEILLEKHKKVDALTLPGGKCDGDEDERVALVRELFEELDILACRYEKIFTREFNNIEYPVHSNNFTDFEQLYYKINMYKGSIINKEPDKHSELIWVNPENIRSMGKISVVLDSYLNLIQI